MTTIKDVAKRAGVSISTVSRVLNGAENVDKVLRDKVNVAVQELAYRPNFAARTMKKHTTQSIGFIIPDFSTPFYEKMIKTIEKEFLGKLLILFINSYDDPKTEMRAIMDMVARQVDVLVISSTGRNEEYLNQLYEHGIKIIFVDRHPLSRKIPSVMADKCDGTVKALEYFKRAGHRRIAIVTGPKEVSSNMDRAKGMNVFLEANPDMIGNISIHFGSFTEDYGIMISEKLLSRSNPPSAILTGSAVIATGIFIYCRNRGITIPDELSIISSGDFAQGELVSPRLSYIGDEHERVSKILIMMINDALNNHLDDDSILLPARLNLNETVKVLD